MNDWNTAIIDEFRANNGKVGGSFDGAPLLILHTTGAKSGKERLAPVMYQAVGDNDDVAVFASKAGAPTHPDWYHNLLADPNATVEVGDETYAAKARVAEGDERERIWGTQKERYPGFAEYEQRTSREIPVVVLERVA
jgi:deazaflavin-dependent oxidoreductase (nitroreductase family)